MNNTLTDLLKDLETAARNLQASLISRDTELIYEHLEQQEKTMSRLGGYCHQQGSGLENIIQHSPALQNMLRRCRSIVHANRSMAQRFLDVIDQTFSHLSGGTTASCSGYGNTSRRNSPILVCQQG